MPVTRVIAVCLLASSLPGCSEDEQQPWNPSELSALTEEFIHIAEAYAVVDVCMPMLDADPDAKYQVVSQIEVKRYSQLSKMKTEAELTNFFAHHQNRGGTDEQYEMIERAYRAAYTDAAAGLRSVEICIETVSDYANTILQTSVRQLR
jgi:hypothetical protein